MERYDRIRPGQPMLDENGFRIQAHGGSIFYEKGTYYWYGENKEKTFPGTHIWHYGVKMYSSKDLYNWKDEGIVLSPVLGTPSPLNPHRIMDRPHILFNEKTKKYVMWMKFAGTEEAPNNWDVQCAGVAVSDNLTGPYTLVRTVNPQGEAKFGDFDLFLDDDGKAYAVYEKPHTEMTFATLTEDFTDFSGEFSSHFAYGNPPFTREAPGVFKRKGTYYVISSGTTGYWPNPTEVGMADRMHGPWKKQGDPCVNDEKRNSFHAQFSSVFHLPNSDLYIALGDRWLTDIPENAPDVMRVFEGWFDPTKKRVMEPEELNRLTAQNTSIADYVWLPIKFVPEEGAPDRVVLEFLPEWKIEDYLK